MVASSTLRWPEPRSPEQLRAFYSIALRIDKPETTGLDRNEDSRSIGAPTSVTLGSNRPHSGSTIFSGQARTGSSRTSLSDSKTITALAPVVRDKETAGLLRLQEEDSPTPRLTLVTFRTDVSPDHTAECSYQSERNLAYFTRGRKWWRTELSRQHDHDEVNIQAAEDEQGTPVVTEPIPEEKPWWDTLQEHAYHNLEEETKLGRVGMWRVKRQHRDLRSSRSNTKRKTDVNLDDVEKDLADEPLLQITTSKSDDETIDSIDDVVDDTVSLMGSAKSTLEHRRYTATRPIDVNRSFLLDLGADQSLRLSIESDLFSCWPTSSLASTLRLSCADQDDISQSLGNTTLTRSKRLPDGESGVFYCLFCFDTFHHFEDWEEHEYSEHVTRQRDWVCMPWGTTQELENGDQICVFCGIVNPEIWHSTYHSMEACLQQTDSQRTFHCKVDLEDHLQEFHDQYDLTEHMEEWSFSIKGANWYWQCGFCERSLVGWEDRARHIGRHFRERLSLSCWDPAVPSFPVNRTTGIAAEWFPRHNMDQKRLRIMKIQQLELRNRYCKSKFKTEDDVRQHEMTWHLPRDVWRCPTKSDARTATFLQTGPLSAFLFPDSPTSSLSDRDTCPYCWEHTKDIFFGLDQDINECSADLGVRVEHLRLEHEFDKCPADLLFFRADQFLLHMVGFHNLKLNNWTKEIMDSCKKTETVPLGGCIIVDEGDIEVR